MCYSPTGKQVLPGNTTVDGPAGPTVGPMSRPMTGGLPYITTCHVTVIIETA